MSDEALSPRQFLKTKRLAITPEQSRVVAEAGALRGGYQAGRLGATKEFEAKDAPQSHPLAAFGAVHPRLQSPLN